MLETILVNIRMFNNEGESESESEGVDINPELDSSNYYTDGEFDVERFRQDFEKHYSSSDEPEEQEESEETPTDDQDGKDEQSEESNTESSDLPEGEEKEKERQPEETPELDGDKQNQAFAKMRNELKQEKQLADFVRNLAEQQGLKPEELMQAYEQRKLEAEAKEKGVPVDVLQRLNQLEREATEAKQAQIAERFNAEVALTKQKYNLDDNQLQSVFDYMAQNGYVGENNTPLINFEDAYILANKDNLIDQAKEQGRQEYLKEKKKKQQSTPANTGQSAGATEVNPSDFTAEDIAKQFEQMGLDNPFET